MARGVGPVASRVAERRTWLLAAGAVVLAGAAGVLVPAPEVATLAAPWWVVALVLVGLGLSELAVVTLRLPGGTARLTPVSVPLALGLLVVPIPVLVVARMVAGALVLGVRRRRPLLDVLLELSAEVMATVVAALVLRRLLPLVGEEPGPALFGLLVLALLVGTVAGDLVRSAAAALHDGDVRGLLVGRDARVAVGFQHLPGAVLGGTLAVAHAVAPWLGLVVAVPTVLMWALMRSHTSVRNRLEDLSRIHAFGSRVGRTAEVTEIARIGVAEVAEHLRSASVALVVLGDGHREVEAWQGDRTLLDALPVGRGGSAWWARLAAEPVLLVGPDSTGPVADDLHRVGRHEAMVALLGDADHVVGVLAVADRTGPLRRYDAADRDRTAALAVELAQALRTGRLHDRVRHEALHDPLTGAPNRAYFDAWASQHLEQLAEDRATAFLMLDLDRFKEVNDTLGHAAGDRLLVEMGDRMRAVVGDDAVLARLGGDEFAVALPDVDLYGLHGVLTAISRSLEQPVDVDGTSVAIGGSIGIAWAPEHGRDVSSIMRRADLAMYDAKDRHERWSQYRPELEATDTMRLGLLGDLRSALRHQQVEVHFQPKVDTADGRIRGVEALARWSHPLEGPLEPEVFISMAEQGGIIGELTDHVLRRALRAQRGWAATGNHVAVSVNVSPLSLMAEGFPDRVEAELLAAGVEPRWLVLEVTERAMLGESPRTLDTLRRLADLGVGLSVDDFGTGFSSLTTLRSMPFGELKIDRSFITGLATGGNDDVIVASTIALAHNLGMQVVAEGVETQAIVDVLRDTGCDVLQGYGICRPLPLEEASAYLAAHVLPTESLPGRPS